MIVKDKLLPMWFYRRMFKISILSSSDGNRISPTQNMNFTKQNDTQNMNSTKEDDKGNKTLDNKNNTTEDDDDNLTKENLAFDWNVTSHSAKEIVF